MPAPVQEVGIAPAGSDGEEFTTLTAADWASFTQRSPDLLITDVSVDADNKATFTAAGGISNRTGMQNHDVHWIPAFATSLAAGMRLEVKLEVFTAPTTRTLDPTMTFGLKRGGENGTQVNQWADNVSGMIRFDNDATDHVGCNTDETPGGAGESVGGTAVQTVIVTLIPGSTTANKTACAAVASDSSGDYLVSRPVSQDKFDVADLGTHGTECSGFFGYQNTGAGTSTADTFTIRLSWRHVTMLAAAA